MQRFLSIQRHTLQKVVVYTALYIITIGLIVSAFTFPESENTNFPILRSIIIVFATILLTKYFFYMIVSPWDDVRIAREQKRFGRKLSCRKNAPRVSVLVPAWNEEVGILTTIGTLLKSTYKNVEVLIINNASTDDTEEKVLAYIATYYQSINIKKPHVDLVYLYEGTQGKGHALNKGVSEAKGDIIMSIDGDCSVLPDTIGHFVDHFVDPDVMAAVGNVKIGNTKTVIGIVQYLEFLFSFYFKKGDSLLNTIYIIGGAAGAFRREVFEKLGGYHPHNITEDIELSVRMQRAGMKIVYAPDALVYTEGAVTLKGLMKQRLRWKRGRFETFMEHKCMFFSTNKEHGKMLTWVMFPLALFGEIQLFCEIFFLTFLYIYSYLTSDFSSFLSGIIVVSSMFAIQIFFDKRQKNIAEFMLLAPIGWLLFYVSTFVEFQALIRSIWGYLRGTELKWQKWERQGVFETPIP